MPYIKQEARDELDPIIDTFPALTTPELDYVITRLAIKQALARPKCFLTLNAIWGVLTGAAQEFYRRLMADYEDQKAFLNGDVYKEAINKYLENK